MMPNRKTNVYGLWHAAILGALGAFSLAMPLPWMNNASSGLAVNGVAGGHRAPIDPALLHTAMGSISIVIALFAGSIALIRFWARRNHTLLYLGIGFLGAGMLDGFHALASSSSIEGFFYSSTSHMMPWTWLASRTFLGIAMLFAGWAWRLETADSPRGGIKEATVYWTGGSLILAALVVLTLVPLPSVYFQEAYFSRPLEFIPGLLFAAAALGTLRKREWSTDSTDNWLVISLIVGLVAQGFVMSRSSEPFDPLFNAAHVLKAASYACVSIGLMMSMYRLFVQGERSSRELIEMNQTLPREVNERLSAQRRAEDGEARIRAIVETAVDGIITINQRGIIQTFNPAAERLFGYSAEESIGQNVSILMPSPYKEEHDSYLENFLTTGEGATIGVTREAVAQRKDGTTFPVDLAISDMRIGDECGFTGIVRDISQRKWAEDELKRHAAELRRSNQELEQFAYIASHDLKEPLRMVGSYTQLLAEEYSDKLDEEGLKYIGYAVDGAQRMKDLIDGLLQYSRVGRDTSPTEPVDLQEVIEWVLENLEIARREADAEIVVGPLPTVMGSRTEMMQLFQNLISNALKFRREVKPIVEVTCEERNGRLKIAVQDNGIGIEPEYRNRVFQIFQRLNARSEYPGTGIGLAMCKKIVERHGGEIWVESQRGHGTTFHFSLDNKVTSQLQSKEAVLQ